MTKEKIELLKMFDKAKELIEKNNKKTETKQQA